MGFAVFRDVIRFEIDHRHIVKFEEANGEGWS